MTFPKKWGFAMTCREFLRKILGAALVALMLWVPRTALATVQIPDTIYLDGQKHFLFSTPLEQYYGPHNPRPPFRYPNTATWRGYQATWEIHRGLLYLKAIRAWIPAGEVGLEALFPRQKGRVPATWFTGRLIVPQGQRLGFAMPHPIYEKYLIITVAKGRVTGQEIRDNSGGAPPRGDDLGEAR
jgi:hypothetical protein